MGLLKRAVDRVRAKPGYAVVANAFVWPYLLYMLSTGCSSARQARPNLVVDSAPKHVYTSQTASPAKAAVYIYTVVKEEPGAAKGSQPDDLKLKVDGALKKNLEDKINSFSNGQLMQRSKTLSNVTQYRDSIDEASSQHNIPENLISAIIAAESNGDYRASSGAGAAGLMQLMPSTAKKVCGVQIDNLVDMRYDPKSSIFGGTGYISHLLDMYGGNAALALAAYNAGPTAINKILKAKHLNSKNAAWDMIKGSLPVQTREYVTKVLAYYMLLEKNLLDIEQLPLYSSFLHTVAKGDTVSKIARAKGTSVEKIMAANPHIKIKERIEIGMQVYLPQNHVVSMR